MRIDKILGAMANLIDGIQSRSAPAVPNPSEGGAQSRYNYLKARQQSEDWKDATKRETFDSLALETEKLLDTAAKNEVEVRSSPSVVNYVCFYSG